jgi:MEMO1 family protein
MATVETGPADYARSCVVALVEGHGVPPVPDGDTYRRRAACFVSLKHRGGELRGCIGTLTPAEPHLGAEIARNAAGAAFHDPRFPPVAAAELPGLSCSVDVLSESEPAEAGELDPTRFGVIVSCGWRRGVLLPDLPGVDSVPRQVGIALQKAGIGLDEPYRLERFTVTRYREGDPEGRECGAPACASDEDD